MNITFYKYEATGNDFILIDARTNSAPLPFITQNAAVLCDRHTGIGADGILVLTRCDSSNDAFLHIINADGSIAKMCGNGMRCAAAYLNAIHDQASQPQGTFDIETLGGLQHAVCTAVSGKTTQVSVTLQRVLPGKLVDIQWDHQKYTGLQVDVGNPHAVFITDEEPEREVQRVGHILSHHETFPDGANIEFIRPIDTRTLQMAVYERGVGPTRACGTGCVASAMAYAKKNNLKGGNILIHTPGGRLNVSIPASCQDHFVLSGPASFVFKGFYSESINILNIS